VDCALNLVVSLNQSLISPVHYEDLVSGSLVQLSQLVNLMARLKAWTTDVESWTLSGTVDMAVNVLNVGLSNMLDDDCFEFPFTISATAEARDFKFGAQLGFAKAHHKITRRRKVWAILTSIFLQ